MKYFIYLVVILAIIYSIYITLTKKNIKIDDTKKTLKLNNYESKSLMTPNENSFYLTLKNLENPPYSLRVHPQINLATIINKKTENRYINELFRNIDFAIFDKDYKKVLLLIELNDSSHNTSKRSERDKKVKAICNDAGIPLITFHTNSPNETKYVINRVLENIKIKQEKATVEDTTTKVED